MKVRQSLLRITLTFIAVALFLALLIFSMTFSLFLTWPWVSGCYIIIGLYLASSIVFYILTIKYNYYIIEKKCIIIRKYNKNLYYYFDDIIYIDEEYSKKHKMILFVTNKKDVRYIVFDRKKIVYDTMMNKCKHLLTYEELMAKYGEIKGLRKPKNK